MLNKFKNAFYNAVAGGIDSVPALKDTDHKEDSKTLSNKFPYTRPHFLQLNLEEEIQLSADKTIRPIIVPRDISKLPWNSGYAEAVNAGKSVRNEDQACLRRAILQHPESRDNLPLRGMSLQSSDQSNPALSLPYVYFAVFDGHAGAGAALAAANQLHHIVHEKLVDIIDHLLPPLDGLPSHHIESTKRGVAFWFLEKEVSKEALIVGALECAFWEMDNLIAGDRKKYNIKGGCTALVALFILGKVYVANAGDSRAVMVRNQVANALSNDFTPESERGRVRRLAALQPHLLGGEFTHLDFKRRLLQKDLGKRVLYRDAHMMGWAYKTVTQEDLKIPVVHGEGKRSRVLATIGVTRGFGDHDLKALNCNIPIKPFLLSQPEVHILDISNESFTLSDTDVLLMGTDGLWDVTSNERAAEILQKSFDLFPSTDPQRLKYRFTSAAQDLVMQSRGKLHERSWRTADSKQASTDDISVFVIPLAPYKKEYAEWKHDYDAIRGMYDNDKDSLEAFGKLSFRMSPVASDKLSPRSETPSTRQVETGSSEEADPAQGSSSSVIINGWEEKTTDAKTLQKKDLEWQFQHGLITEGFGGDSKSKKFISTSEGMGFSEGKSEIYNATVIGDKKVKLKAIRGRGPIPVDSVDADNSSLIKKQKEQRKPKEGTTNTKSMPDTGSDDTLPNKSHHLVKGGESQSTTSLGDDLPCLRESDAQVLNLVQVETVVESGIETTPIYPSVCAGTEIMPTQLEQGLSGESMLASLAGDASSGGNLDCDNTSSSETEVQITEGSARLSSETTMDSIVPISNTSVTLKADPSRQP